MRPRYYGVLVDQKSRDLAEHFMESVRGHTAEHVSELAAAIQLTCEEHCSDAEAEISEGKP